MKPSLLLLVLVMLAFTRTFAQVGINTDSSVPDNSAMLDVKSSTKGFLPPRIALTAANIPAPVTSPATGLFVFNTATSGISPNDVVPGYYCWNGTRWVAAIMPQGTTAGDMLFWNGTQWVVVATGSYGQQLFICDGIPRWGGCPPVVSTTAVTGITGVTSVSGGNVTLDGGCTVTARGVCCSTAPNPTTANSHTNDGSGTGTYTSNLTGLVPGTLYHVRAYAVNSTGISYGNELTFTTNTYPTVTTTAVTNITGTTAVSGGNVTSDGGSTVTERGVCWGKDVNPEPDEELANYTVCGGGTGIFTCNISDLEKGTKYHVRAYAINTIDISYGIDRIFYTLNYPAVNTSPVSAITTISAMCGGYIDEEGDGGANVTARGVCWSTSPGPTISGNHTTDGSGTGTFTSSLTGLVFGTLYYVSAYATNSVGTGYGSEISFTTMSTCGTSFTVNHQTSGGVAPVNKSVTYGTVTNVPGEPAKCWITRNLGADQQASAVNDATEPSAGWYWQVNRKQGYKNTGGTSVTPAWNTTPINENSNWTAVNDPCTIELGVGWRIPTYTEWTNVDGSSGGNWTSPSGPWNSLLKMHEAGYLDKSNGSLGNRGIFGDYWSGTQSSTTLSNVLDFGNSSCGMVIRDKMYGFTVRCIH